MAESYSTEFECAGRLEVVKAVGVESGYVKPLNP